ncbi:MAG: hypothetical protein K6G10_04895 [Butyrivibrio sp.]|nr:hypothetical protein [Butyrivibrio sp.]
MRKKSLIYSLIVFVLLVVFFIVLHPIAIFDTDDWNFIHNLRIPIPLIGAWNPTKVFPEFFLPLFSYIGAFVLYPLTGNYCFSLSVSNGIFICFIITVYFTEFFLLISKKFDFSTVKSVLISAVFIGLHFCAIAHPGNDNVFLFYAYDMNCVYNYILSTLLNASLVMHLMRTGGLDRWKELPKSHKFCLGIWIYLAVFSNLYSSIVLGVYIGVELLQTLIEDKRDHSFKLKDYWANNKTLLIITIIWLCSFIIELTGERATLHATGIAHNILSAAKRILTWFNRFNLVFIVFAGIIIIARVVLMKKKNIVDDMKCLAALGLTTLYIVLLSAVVDFTYVYRTDVILPVAFWALLLLMLFLGSLMEKINYGNVILAVTAAVSVMGTVYFSDTYKEINYINAPYKTCEAFVDDVINQFMQAESQGKTETDLVLPKFETDDNWPIADYAAESFSNAMYYHGVTETKVTVNNLVFTKEKNKELGIY